MLCPFIDICNRPRKEWQLDQIQFHQLRFQALAKILRRLHLRDQKSTYLADLPLVTEYVREALALTAGSHSSVAEFRDWFESDLMSVISEQPWYEAIDAEGWIV